MSKVTGFEPIIKSEAQCIVLGSMPSNMSLKKHEYYGHPRNAFWAIASSILKFDLTLSYPKRLAHLNRAGIGLWDVLKHCERKTSLDSHIVNESIVVNDFSPFFTRYSKIKTIFFNGAKSEQLFRKHVAPNQVEFLQAVNLIKLPSTSPAYAAMSFEKKLEQWRAVFS